MATNLGTLVLKFVGDTSGLTQSFAQANKMIGGAGGAAGGIGGAGVTGAILAAKAIETGLSTAVHLGKELAATMYDTFKWIAQSGAEMERAQTAMQTLIGSTQGGKDVFQDLQKLSLNTTGSLADMMPNAQLLLAYGVAGKDVVRVMKELSDVQAATGRNMNHLALAYGEVMTQGHLSARIMTQQLSRAGVGAATLADAAGMSETKLMGMVKAGTFTSDMFASAFSKMTEKGGIFFQAQQRGLETVVGQWGKLVKTIDMVAGKIGMELFTRFPIAKFLDGITDEIANINIDNLFKSLGGIGQAIMPGIQAIAEFGLGVANAGMMLAKNLLPASREIGQVIKSMTGFGMMLAEGILAAVKAALVLHDVLIAISAIKIATALITNPYQTLAAIGVATAVVGVSGMEKLWSAISGTSKAADKLGAALDKIDLKKSFANAHATIEGIAGPLRDKKGGVSPVDAEQEAMRKQEALVKAETKAYMAALESAMPGFGEGIDKLLKEVIDPGATLSKEGKFFRDVQAIQLDRGVDNNDDLNRALFKKFKDAGGLDHKDEPIHNAIAAGTSAAYSAVNQAMSNQKAAGEGPSGVEATWDAMRDLAEKQLAEEKEITKALRDLADRDFGVGLGGGR